MCRQVNPLEAGNRVDTSRKQTVEIRSADGSADVYQLLAGITVACRYGLEMEDALALARRTYVDINIHLAANRDKVDALEHLPDSCAASAERLRQQRAVYEQYDIFSPAMIDGIINRLLSYRDENLREEVTADPSKMTELITAYFHCG